jgi:hypothetical protein
MKQKVAVEIKTTFATTYAKEISLREALSLENLHVRFTPPPHLNLFLAGLRMPAQSLRFPSHPTSLCQEYQAKGTSAKHLIVPHKMDETQRQAAKDLLDLAGKMAKL